MKQYEYVHLHIDKFFGAKSKEHRQIMDEYAKKVTVMLVIFPQILQILEK